MKILRKIKTYNSLNEREKSIFFKVVFNYYKYGILTRVLPFRFFIKKLKFQPTYQIEIPDEVFVINTLVKMMKKASKYTIVRNKCLEKSISAKIILNNYGISSTLYLGLNKSESKLKAHAWVWTNYRIIDLTNTDISKYTVINAIN